MKKSISFLFLLFIYTAITAQVTLERRYDYSTAVVQFETHGYKYYLMDVLNGQCRIYNLDHSLFRTINCNIPNGFFLSDIKFLSEKLFDNDAGIELLCTFYKYNATPGYYEYDSKIINEDGSQLQFIDGGLYNFINKTGENEYKLFSYCYDFSTIPEKVWTNIYNLPGSPVLSSLLEDHQPGISLNAFPNPAYHSVKVAYTLPAGIRDGTLFLYDNNGKLVTRYDVDNHSDHLLLDVSGYSVGLYHYFVDYGSGRSPSKKLVIR